MLFFSICKSRESIFIFGDDEDVCGCYGSDISEGKDVLIFIDDSGGYFLTYDFIKDGFLVHRYD